MPAATYPIPVQLTTRTSTGNPGKNAASGAPDGSPWVYPNSATAFRCQTSHCSQARQTFG